MLGDERVLLIWTIEVTYWDGTIFERSGREEVVRVTVLLDELLGHDPQDLSPDFTDSMDAPVSWLVEGLVGRWVDRLIL
jgi:hypothetical protein